MVYNKIRLTGTNIIVLREANKQLTACLAAKFPDMKRPEPIVDYTDSLSKFKLDNDTFNIVVESVRGEAKACKIPGDATVTAYASLDMDFDAVTKLRVFRDMMAALNKPPHRTADDEVKEIVHVAKKRRVDTLRKQLDQLRAGTIEKFRQDLDAVLEAAAADDATVES